MVLISNKYIQKLELELEKINYLRKNGDGHAWRITLFITLPIRDKCVRYTYVYIKII